jgi:hypothetical protein
MLLLLLQFSSTPLLELIPLVSFCNEQEKYVHRRVLQRRFEGVGAGGAMEEVREETERAHGRSRYLVVSDADDANTFALLLLLPVSHG